MLYDHNGADMNNGSISLNSAVGMGPGVMIWTRSRALKNLIILGVCHCFTPHFGLGT